jgi:hypothetical protein
MIQIEQTGFRLNPTIALMKKSLSFLVVIVPRQPSSAVRETKPPGVVSFSGIKIVHAEDKKTG